MKIIHTSDWHFGMPVGTGSYQDCQVYFLEQLYGLIRDEQAQAVILAGDVFDSSVANAQAIGLFNDAASAICGELGVKFIVIAGNHDGPARLAAHRELLRNAGLYVSGRLEREIEPVLLDGGRVAVYPVPFFNRDEVIALFPERREEIRSQETAMMVVCDHIRERMDRSRVNILVSHALIVNAELSESDRSARVGFATAVSKAALEGFDYVALGHIHKPQVITPHIRYSGSPIQYSFGSEEKQEKGVVVLDTDTLEQRFAALPQLRRRKTAEGTYDELMEREDLKGDYLRLKVTDRYAGLELQAALREKFPYLLEVYGKSLTEGEELSALSVEQLQSLDETDIMEKFMGEHFQYSPTEEQRALFRAVLQWSQKEDEA